MKANQRKFQVRSQLQNNFSNGQDNVKVNLETPKKQKMPSGHDYQEYESTVAD